MAMIVAYKMDGLGNDFLIIDRRFSSIDLDKEKIIKLGKRDSIGFDQIIFIDKEIENNFPITIFNSDGNEINACGNGSRCVAYLLSKEKKIKNIFLKTKERILKAEIIDNLLVRINMGKPIFDWEKIPLSKNLDYKNIDILLSNKKKLTNGFALNLGNPHIIFFVNDCLKFDLKKIGPEIENYSLFPEKCNVTLAQINDKDNITVNVWERGAGLTKACGSAACATAVAGHLKGFSNNVVNIKFHQGILKIEYDKNQNIFMTGPVSDIKKIKLEI
tara:strand:+ start:1919 stop:2740 length:822 start_codon:yes stop_codon:yes gene_type:complete